MASAETHTTPNNRPQPPPGLKALIEHFQSVYPDQPNPMQVTTVIKYWLGGQDPLDYISMYYNRGDPEKNVPPHWHYISFGLSDLHGDGRVHTHDSDEFNPRSGMGFELTFRLLKPEIEQNEAAALKPQYPPTWPANLLQSIARYCFQTGNMLCCGDNIPWRKGLDNSNTTRMQNILIAQDPQLNSIQTQFGTVDFCQIVGVTDEELEQASRWNGRGVLNYLRQDIQTGGEWLVTDMNRTLSVFELFPETLLNLQDDLEKQGSDLAGVNANFTFRELQPQKHNIKQEIDFRSLNEQCMLEENNRTMRENNDELKEESILDKNKSPEESQAKREDSNFPQSMSMSSNSLHKSCPLNYQPAAVDCISLDGIEITLAAYAAKFLLLAIKDRIRHGRHFTFKSQHLALTLVAESVTGAVVNKAAPYGVIGYWIQVLIPDELVPRMIEAFQGAQLDGKAQIEQRLEFEWPDWKLKLVIDNPNPMGIIPLNL